MANSVYRVYPSQNGEIKQGSITVFNGTAPSNSDRHPTVSYMEASGAFIHFPQPKNPTDRIDQFDADDANLPSAGNPALVVRNNHDLLAFDAATTETAYFDGVIAQNYKGHDIRATLLWTSETGVSGNVMWDIGMARIYVDDETAASSSNIMTDSYGTIASGVTAAPAASGRMVESEFQLSAAHLNSIHAGDNYRLRVRRVGGVAADTMGGDAQLYSVKMDELV